MGKPANTNQCIYKPFMMPDGIEAAAHRFAGECLLRGFGGFANMSADSGIVRSIAVEKDGAVHVAFLIEGDWYELVELEGRMKDD